MDCENALIVRVYVCVCGSGVITSSPHKKNSLNLITIGLNIMEMASNKTRNP